MLAPLTSSILLAQDWSLINKLTPLVLDNNDGLGMAIDIDGSVLAIGAWTDDMNETPTRVSEAGAAYVYEKNMSGTWVLQDKVFSPNPESLGYFGHAVAVVGDEVIIGAYNEDTDQNTILNNGRVYIFEKRTNSGYELKQILQAPDGNNGDFFGFTLATSEEHLVVGAHNHRLDLAGNNPLRESGAVYISENKMISGIIYKN